MTASEDELTLFTTRFGEKLVELGFDERFVEEYTKLKMRVRELEQENAALRNDLEYWRNHK